MPSAIFVPLGRHIEAKTQVFYSAAASDLAGSIGVIALAGITMVISVYGALIIAGKIQQPFGDFMVKAAKWMIVAAVALNAGNYLSWVVQGVDGLQNGLVQAMSAGNGADIYERLDQALREADALMAQIDKQADALGWSDIGTAITMALCICIIGFGTMLFVVVAGAMVIVAKFMLAMMFAVGPIFVMCLMWPSTAGFFDRWISQTLTYVFTIVFITVLLSMGLAIFRSGVASAAVQLAAGDGGGYFTITFGFFAICLVLGWIAFQVPTMASAVSGGASMAALTLRQIAAPVGAVGNLAGASTPFLAKAGRQSTRLDPRTGHQTTSSGLEHTLQGRTVYARNPAYRNAVMDRFNQSWRRGNSVRGS